MPPRVAAAGLMLAVAVAVVCTAPAAQVDTELHALLQKASNALHSQRWREARSLYKEADARVKTGSGSPAAADGLAQVYQGLQREAAKQGDERQQARYFEKAAEQLRRLVQHYRQLFSSEMRGRRHGPITVLDNDDNEGDGGPSLGEYLGHAEFNYGAHLAAAPALARTAITERDADAHLAAAVAADPGMHNARALLALRRARAGAHDRAWPLLEGIKADEVDSSVGSKLDVLALKGATCARLTAPDYSCAIDAYEALLAEPVPALPVTPRAAEAGVSNDGSIVVDDVTEHAWRRRDHAQQKRMEAHAELVRLQLARGKPRRALRAARAAVEDGFDVWDVREARAVAQWRLGNWDRALEVYKQAYAAISEAHGSLQPGEPLPTWWSDVEQSMGASLSWLRYEQEREARESEDRPTTVDDGSSGHVYRPGGRVDGSGGWSPEFSLSADSSECEIDRRSDLSKHDFLMQYVDANKPVLMTGAATEWPAGQAWTRSRLLERFGGMDVLLRNGSSVAGSLDDEAPRGTPTVTFTEFVNTYMPNDGKRRPGDSGMSQRYDPPYVYEVDPFPGESHELRRRDTALSPTLCC